VGKLLGFDFSVEYRSGATNVVADALSHRDNEEGEVLAISAPRFDFIERLRHAQATDPDGNKSLYLVFVGVVFLSILDCF
jgi:hypothetical protein